VRSLTIEYEEREAWAAEFSFLGVKVSAFAVMRITRLWRTRFERKLHRVFGGLVLPDCLRCEV
ncbi:hypothetical protein, partial [Aquamicrobium lusatiense]|uniref:hypothetical protein n=1 Tax=Aquamicrobium lusatiense TaxID=89772 RepID=UPI001AED9369